jgi:hypothetical protein
VLVDELDVDVAHTSHPTPEVSSFLRIIHSHTPFRYSVRLTRPSKVRCTSADRIDDVSQKRWFRICSSPTAQSPASPTGPPSLPPTRGRRLIPHRFCGTSCPSDSTRTSTRCLSPACAIVSCPQQCVERIYLDLMSRCQPSRLAVHAKYTRRGGLDINPFRATPGSSAPVDATRSRTARQ